MSCVGVRVGLWRWRDPTLSHVVGLVCHCHGARAGTTTPAQPSSRGGQRHGEGEAEGLKLLKMTLCWWCTSYYDAARSVGRLSRGNPIPGTGDWCCYHILMANGTTANGILLLREGIHHVEAAHPDAECGITLSLTVKT